MKSTVLENYLNKLWDGYPEGVKKTMDVKTREEFIAEQMKIAEDADVMEESDSLTQEDKDLIELSDKNVSEVKFGDSRVNEEVLNDSITISQKLSEKEYSSSISFTRGEDQIVINRTGKRTIIPVRVFADFMKEFIDTTTNGVYNTITVGW